MDELKDKFKTIFSKASNSANKLGSKKFAGQGHRLGTAEERGLQPKVHSQRSPAHPTAGAVNNSRASAGARSQPGVTAGQQQQQSVTGAAGASQPTAGVLVGGQLAPAPARATIPPSAAASTPSPSCPTHPVHVPSGTPAASSSSAAACSPPNSLPPASLEAPVTAEVVEQLQVCLAMISSQPDAADSLQVLSKLLGNLLAAPQEAKYRHIRLTNPKIHRAVVQVEGALEFLSVAGFEIHAAAGQTPADSSLDPSQAAAGGDDGFAVFLDDCQMGLVKESVRQLQQALQAAQQQQLSPSQLTCQQQPPHAASPQQLAAPAVSAVSGIASAAPAPAAPAAAAPALQRNRHTQVLLPAAPDAEVPDWFFERTGAEVKAEYMAMLKQRQTSELLASKAWKDAKQGKHGQGPAPTEATVRVRFPEGVCLQGRFHVSEPLSALFEWVTDALRGPATTYELVAPDRKPLPVTGKVGDADLAPSVLLNFRPLRHAQHLLDSAGVQQSFLRDQLLRQARAD